MPTLAYFSYRSLCCLEVMWSSAMCEQSSRLLDFKLSFKVSLYLRNAVSMIKDMEGKLRQQSFTLLLLGEVFIISCITVGGI